MEKSTNFIYQVSGSELEQVVKSAVREALAEMKDLVSSEPEERFLSRNETAQMLSCTTTTLWRIARKGLLVPLKMGSKSCYKLSEVQSFMNKGC